MATTRQEFFKLLKEISAQIDQLSKRKYSVSGKTGGASPDRAALRDILTTLNSILVDTGRIDIQTDDVATQTSLAAVVTNTNDIELLLTTIDAVLDDILTDTGQMETLLTSIDTELDSIDANTFVARERLIAGGKNVAQWGQDIDANTEQMLLDNDAIIIDLAAIEALAITAATARIAAATARTDINAELDSIDDNWNLLSTNQVNLAAILVAVLNNATSGRQDTSQTSFDTMLTDNDLMIADLDAIRLSNITINTSLDAIESDVDQIRISTSNIAASVIATGSSHTLNWFYDFTVGAAGAGSFIITLTIPTGQKLTNAWSTIIMPVRGSSETVEWHVLSASDVHTRRLSERTIANTTTRYHMPNEEAHTNTGHIDGRSQVITVPAGQKLQWTFSTDLSNDDQVQIRCGGDLRDGTTFAAATRTGTVTGTLNSEDHEEIA